MSYWGWLCLYAVVSVAVAVVGLMVRFKLANRRQP